MAKAFELKVVPAGVDNKQGLLLTAAALKASHRPNLKFDPRLLQALNRKDKPWCYVDTHAGAGLYNLASNDAMRTGEWQQGIGRLRVEPGTPALVRDYLALIDWDESRPQSPECGREQVLQGGVYSEGNRSLDQSPGSLGKRAGGNQGRV